MIQRIRSHWRYETSLVFLVFLVLIFLTGVLIPGSWRDSLARAIDSPFQLSSAVHLLFFFSVSVLTINRPLSWPATRVILGSFAFALVTEGLQFFAVGREPSVADIGFDIAGTLLGFLVGLLLQRFFGISDSDAFVTRE